MKESRTEAHRWNEGLWLTNPSPSWICLRRKHIKQRGQFFESRETNYAWNEDTVYALGPYRLAGRILGVWPSQSKDCGSKTRFLGFIILQFLMICTFIQEFKNDPITLSNAVNYIGIVGTTVVSMLKIIVLRSHQSTMNCIVEAAVNDWSIIRDIESRKIMREHAFIGRFISIFQWSSSYVSVVLHILRAPPTFTQTSIEMLDVANNKTNIAVPRNLPFGSGHLMANFPTVLYLAIYLFQVLQSLTMCTCTVGGDAIFLGFVLHVGGQLEILKKHIERLNPDISGRNIREYIADLIKRHIFLTDLANNVEDVFHIILIGQLIASILHISLLGILILFGLQTLDYMVFMYVFITIMALLFQIYIYYRAGDYLSTQIMQVRNAAYNCSWYNFSPSVAKDIMLMIVRSNRSYHLTAGKLCHMNVENFTSLLKAMLSFFSVFKLTIIDYK